MKRPSESFLVNVGKWTTARIEAGRMTEAAGTDARAATRVRRNIEDDIVGMISVPCEQRSDSTDSHQIVQVQVGPHQPANPMIGARSVAADTHGADDATRIALANSVKRQATAKDVYATNLLAHQRIIPRAIKE